MKMRKARLLAVVLGLSLFLPGLAAAQSKSGGNLPAVKYEQFTLPNGLNVIMHVDKSTPIVAVDLWYHVGSKNEVRGRTGFAHLFEHMMFQGSKNYNDDYFKPLQEAGANINGSTNADRTNYFEIRPVQLSRAGVVYGSRSYGWPARRHDDGKAQQPARRSEE